MGRSIHKANPKPGDKPMGSDEWCTPPEIADPLFDFWGECDLDPCSNDRSIVRARARYDVGGLMLPWRGTVYQNHPYSANEPWVDKAIYELRDGMVKQLVVLCMTATSTVWWKKLMTVPEQNPRVICTKRLKFLGPDGTQLDSSRFEPALIYIGPHEKYVKFDRCFASVAMWSTWGR